MVDRRTLLKASTSVGSVLATALGAGKAAAETRAFDIEPRGTKGNLERLPTLDLESIHDFLTSFRVWVNDDMNPAAARRIDAILEAEGIDPMEVSVEELMPLVENDPLVGTSIRTYIGCQNHSHQTLLTEFHNDADRYLAEMEATDYIGPGSLELNPELDVPAYTKHEIHMQPGGYVGEPFAGHVYHYSTNNFYAGFLGSNEQDQIHRRAASGVPGPSMGSIERILDMGCGPGQLTVALKERFPEAEVWGIDVGGPMVRYGHMRAVDLNVPVHFAQRLAEDSKFPDDHFDIVTAYIMFHEVSAAAAVDIINEIYRVTRPGGVFYPMDFEMLPVSGESAFTKFRRQWDHRWNNEVWRLEWAALDFPAVVRAAGFDVEIQTGGTRFDRVIATKPV